MFLLGGSGTLDLTHMSRRLALVKGDQLFVTLTTLFFNHLEVAVGQTTPQYPGERGKKKLLKDCYRRVAVFPQKGSQLLVLIYSRVEMAAVQPQVPARPSASCSSSANLQEKSAAVACFQASYCSSLGSSKSPLLLPVFVRMPFFPS